MSEMGLAMMGTGTARGDDRAQAAAEAAISNPLLDEVNLAGACGVLVNITAGPNFTMREFDEVGRTIEEFASEDATVVLGTVLDPDMQDDVRVTVVATGLNRGVQAGRLPNRDHGRASFDAAPRGHEREAARSKVQLIRNGSTGMAEFADAVGPAATVGRDAGFGGAPAGGREPSFAGGLRGRSADVAGPTALSDLPADQAYLDIPAFLRRQAD
jgi:cell division protein FtsZ